jgi:hypothetical protein
MYPTAPCCRRIASSSKFLDLIVTANMHAFRSTARVASQFRPAAFPRFARGYATQKTYEHLLVSTPKPGVGFGELHSICLSFPPSLSL